MRNNTFFRRKARHSRREVIQFIDARGKEDMTTMCNWLKTKKCTDARETAYCKVSQGLRFQCLVEGKWSLLVRSQKAFKSKITPEERCTFLKQHCSDADKSISCQQVALVTGGKKAICLNKAGVLKTASVCNYVIDNRAGNALRFSFCYAWALQVFLIAL